MLHYWMILPYVRHLLHTSKLQTWHMLHYCMIMPYIRHNPSVLLHYATDMSCKLRRITELHTCRTSYNTPYASLLPDSSGRPACCTLPRHLRTRPMLHYRMIMPYIHHNSCTLNLTLLPSMCRDINPPASQNGGGYQSQHRILCMEYPHMSVASTFTSYHKLHPLPLRNTSNFGIARKIKREG